MEGNLVGFLPRTLFPFREREACGARKNRQLRGFSIIHGGMCKCSLSSSHMLTVTHVGGQTIKISGGGLSALFFPKDGKLGPSTKDTLTFLSVPEETPTPGVISWPGEYHEKDVAIRGIGHLEGQQVSYVLEWDGVRVAVLSSPLQDFTDFQLEQIGDADAMIFPAEDAKLLQKLFDEIDPQTLIVLPGKDSKAREEVLKLCGAVNKEVVSEHKIKAGPTADAREVVLMGK